VFAESISVLVIVADNLVPDLTGVSAGRTSELLVAADNSVIAADMEIAELGNTEDTGFEIDTETVELFVDIEPVAAVDTGIVAFLAGIGQIVASAADTERVAASSEILATEQMIASAGTKSTAAVPVDTEKTDTAAYIAADVAAGS
jgi:hypothetical protein